MTQENEGGFHGNDARKEKEKRKYVGAFGMCKN